MKLNFIAVTISNMLYVWAQQEPASTITCEEGSVLVTKPDYNFSNVDNPADALRICNSNGYNRLCDRGDIGFACGPLYTSQGIGYYSNGLAVDVCGESGWRPGSAPAVPACCDTCEPLECPSGSIGENFKDSGCFCPVGYEGSITFNRTAPNNYISNCTKIGCPKDSYGKDLISGCKCNKGLNGNVTLQMNFPYYINTCGKNEPGGSMTLNVHMASVTGLLILKYLM